MEGRSYKILFRFFSYLSGKPGRFPFFIKYKLIVGTFLLGLSQISCNKPTQPIGIETMKVIEDSILQRDVFIQVPDPTEVFPSEVIDIPPVAPEGDLITFLEGVRSRIKYSDQMLIKEEEGIVTVCFIIDEEGNLVDINIMRSFSFDANKEVIRILSLSKPWIPGKHKGKKVKTSFTLPVVFKLPKN
jgi:Periplasmic protein TonB, links inner and outer membranes